MTPTAAEVLGMEFEDKSIKLGTTPLRFHKGQDWFLEHIPSTRQIPASLLSPDDSGRAENSTKTKEVKNSVYSVG